MPLFEYKCDKCGHLLEMLQKFGAQAPLQCPHCEAKNSLHKAVSNTSFQLKGGGWYKDLYGSVKPKSETKESKPAEKTEKPAPKSDPKK